MTSKTTIELTHTGYSGLRLTIGEECLHIDPHEEVDGDVAITWTERERVLGVSNACSLAASPEVLGWLDAKGVPLRAGRNATLGGLTIRALPYKPIPYATPAEAVRKTLSAIRDPRRAADRLSFLATRPRTKPIALVVEAGGRRVALLGQSLHRFTTEERVAELIEFVGEVDLLVAGTDFDDEATTGVLIGSFNAANFVIADLVGTVRRELNLPTRPLETCLNTAPEGTALLPPHGSFSC